MQSTNTDDDDAAQPIQEYRDGRGGYYPIAERVFKYMNPFIPSITLPAVPLALLVAREMAAASRPSDADGTLH